MHRNGVHYIAQPIVHIPSRCKRTPEGVDSRQFRIPIDLLPKRNACSPASGSSSVISKPIGEIILEIICAWKNATSLTVDGNVPIVVVESSELQHPTVADFAVCGNLFMQAILQHRMAIAVKQGWEGVQLIQSRSQHFAGLRPGGLQWTGSARHRSENKVRAPALRDPVTEFRTRAQRRSRGAQPHQNVFAAVAQEHAITKRESTALVQSYASKAWPLGSDLGFPHHQRRVWART